MSDLRLVFSSLGPPTRRAVPSPSEPPEAGKELLHCPELLHKLSRLERLRPGAVTVVLGFVDEYLRTVSTQK
jgi:hypothetical protein